MESQFHFDQVVSTFQLHSCSFVTRPSGAVYRKHHNQLFELFCCLKGSIISSIQNQSTLMAAGDWVLIKPRTKHQFHNETGHGYSFFHLHFDLDDKHLRERLSSRSYRYINRNTPAGQQLEILLREIQKLITDESGSSIQVKLSLQAYILLMLSELMAAQAEEEKVESGSIEVEGQQTVYAVNMAHDIEERLQTLLYRPGLVKEIAQSLHLSNSQCTKIFSRVYGVAPREYLTQLKINKAKEWLVASSMPVSEIAEKLGFNSIQAFSRQFRRWTGQSPSKFRS